VTKKLKARRSLDEILASASDVLFPAGARTDIRSEFGETVLDRAIRSGGELAKLLRRFVGA
jgi:hypothetical protein